MGEGGSVSPAGRNQGSHALHIPGGRGYFEKELTALDRLPKPNGAYELALDLRFELRNAFWPLGEFDRLLKVLREAEGTGVRREKRLGWVSLYLAANLWITGHPAEARSAVEEILAIGVAIISVRPRLPLHRPGEARLRASPARARLCLSARMAPHVLWPLVSWFLGHAYVRSGRTAEGVSLLEGAQSAFRSLGSGAFQPFVLVHLGEAYLKVGRQEDAIDAAREALRFSRERGQRGYEAYALRLLGEIASVPGAAKAAEAASC